MNVQTRSARDGAKNETGRERHHVHVREALQEARVEALHDRVRENRAERDRARRVDHDDESRVREAGGEKDEPHPDGGNAVYRAGGDGPEAFYRVEPVGLVVGDIVKKIERRGDEGEGPRHRNRHQKRLPAPRERSLRRVGDGKEPRRHDDAVLRPLLDANRL